MIILGIEVQDRAAIRGLSREFRAEKKDVLQDVAGHWHSEILPKHFGAGNRGKYRHEQRNPVYQKEIKPKQGRGQGRFGDLLLSGQSRRFLQAFATISGTAAVATLTMRPPGYFTNPFKGSWTDPETGKQKRITRQPDKVAELTNQTNDDRRALQVVAEKRLQKWMTQARTAKTQRITG